MHIDYTAKDIARFWAKVDKSGGSDACWPWTASKVRGGYGQLKWLGKQALAHRIAWELTYGTIPEGKKVLHHCDNPPCCNVFHYFLGSLADNLNDMTAKGRRAVGDRHGRTKISQHDRALIREQFAMGLITKSALARQYAVANTTIAYILSTS